LHNISDRLGAHSRTMYKPTWENVKSKETALIRIWGAPFRYAACRITGNLSWILSWFRMFFRQIWTEQFTMKVEYAWKSPTDQ